MCPETLPARLVSNTASSQSLRCISVFTLNHTLEALLKAAILGTLLAGASTLAAAQPIGEFQGKVVVEWLVDDGEPDRDMRLVEPFSFVDSNGNAWAVPAGAVVNGASIPRPLWTPLGSPFVGDYRRASVVHDYFCTTRSRPWRAVHRMFFDGLVASAVPMLKAKVLYAAVLRGGPRWSGVAGAEPGGPRFNKVAAPFSQTEFEDLQDWVLTNDPTLSELEREVQRLLEEQR